jgi:hypothetical protein
MEGDVRPPGSNLNHKSEVIHQMLLILQKSINPRFKSAIQTTCPANGGIRQFLHLAPFRGRVKPSGEGFESIAGNHSTFVAVVRTVFT